MAGDAAAELSVAARTELVDVHSYLFFDDSGKVLASSLQVRAAAAGAAWGRRSAQQLRVASCTRRMAAAWGAHAAAARSRGAWHPLCRSIRLS